MSCGKRKRESYRRRKMKRIIERERKRKEKKSKRSWGRYNQIEKERDTERMKERNNASKRGKE